MIFGNETPFHLKPIPYRGLRKHEAEVTQHYPGYQHPMLIREATNDPSFIYYNGSYQSEKHRLLPALTAADELKQEQRLKREAKEKLLERRRAEQCQREQEVLWQRKEEQEAQKRRLEALVNTDRKNRDSEGMDTITHQCVTRSAQERCAHDDAMNRHNYFLRQKRIANRLNPHGYNIITGESLKDIEVPPRPEAASAERE